MTVVDNAISNVFKLYLTTIVSPVVSRSGFSNFSQFFSHTNAAINYSICKRQSPTTRFPRFPRRILFTFF